MSSEGLALDTAARPRAAWLRAGLRAGYAGFAALLLVALLVVNVILDPARFAPAALGTTLGLAAPLILAAIAVTPAILSGGGGIDLSVGPLMGLLNALIVQELLTAWGLSSPLVVVPVALLAGVASGALNGTLAALFRLQPIVATLGTYLVYGGLTLWLLPTPGGSIPDWLATLAGGLSFVPILAVVVGWWAITRTPYYEHLMATGGDDRAAYASGVAVVWVRFVAYVLSGLCAGVAALSLTALLGSADAAVGPPFTLTAVAAAALGGVSLAGGRGGILGAIIGAIDLFLVNSLLTYFNASTFAQQVAYGVILVVAVVLNATVTRVWGRRAARRAGR